MKRQVSLEEISDGRLYSRNDMVRAGCKDCEGCSDCCGGMGNSVILDPMDLFRLSEGTGLAFEALMEDKIELSVVDGIILPNLKMSSGEETCAFLNPEGRCGIHPYRPGICRLFPLGRYYDREARTFRYFLQVHECPMPNKTKVKVEKWMDTPNLSRYERFINDWHYFLEDVQEQLAQADDTRIKNVNLFLLKLFYIRPYRQEQDFYSQFEERLAQAKEVLEIRD